MRFSVSFVIYQRWKVSVLERGRISVHRLWGQTGLSVNPGSATYSSVALGCHPSFFVPFIECRQSKFSIIIKVHRTFKIVNEHCLHLKTPVASASKRRVSLSFEARHWLFLCSYENPGWHLLPTVFQTVEDSFIYTENLFSDVTLIISARSSGSFAVASP